MKKSIVCLMIFFSIFLITGCGKDYGRKDIINYVKEELKINNIRISKTYQEVKNEQGYKDKVWTVTNKENNITFHVLDNYYDNSPFGTSNKLMNDYDESVFNELYSLMNIKNNIIYDYKSNNLFNEVNLICNYSTKKDLKDCYDSLLSYKKFIEDKNYDLEINYTLNYNFPLNEIGEYKSTLGITSGYLNKLNDSVYNEALYDYLSTALIYQIENGVNEITEEDMKQILENDETHLIFIKRADGSETQYNDIIAHHHSYGISFGTLYKILVNEGFNPIGNPWHYTVINKNGDKFEFSYDFNDYVYENGNVGYYYKKNNEKIKMNYYFYNCFKPYKINEMFGINIEEKRI